MKTQLFTNKRANFYLNLLVLAGFVVLGYLRYSGNNESGDDLSSSYVGCRLMSAGSAPAHLYKHDGTDFSAIGADDAWQAAADAGDFKGYLHPYVQTPLWAFALEPLCTRTNFLTFKKIFAALTMLSFAGSIWLVARCWTPSLYNPVGLGLVCVALALSRPFGYAMFLMQTHVLFFLMMIAALILAERQKPLLAGLLLAVAAAVKITPCLLILYWLLTRRWKAAAYMAGWLALLSAATVLAVGLPLWRMYLAELNRVSHVLLVSQNNQSLAAWWMARFHDPDEVFDVTIFSLPTVVRLVSSGLMLACTLAGAAIDRSRNPQRASNGPIGAMIALLAATLFAPIAWTHYSIVLIAPLMLLWQANRTLRSYVLVLAIGVIGMLNYRPFASDVVHGGVGRFAVLRGQFFAGLLCMAMLAWVAWRSRQAESTIQAVGH